MSVKASFLTAQGREVFAEFQKQVDDYASNIRATFNLSLSSPTTSGSARFRAKAAMESEILERRQRAVILATEVDSSYKQIELVERSFRVADTPELH